MDSWFSDPDFNAGMPFFDYANDMPSDHMPSDPAPQASMYPASPLEARRMSAFAATNDPELQLDPYQASTVARASGRRPSLPQVPQGPLRFPTGTAYSEVIWNCLKEKPDHRSSLKEIYKYFEKHTDRDHEALRFAALGDKVGFRKERTGWQCSVRHNLSMNEGVQSEGRGFWILLPKCYNGIEPTTRFRKNKNKSRSASPAPESSESTRDRRVAAGRRGGEASRRHDRRLRHRAHHNEMGTSSQTIGQLPLPDISSYDFGAFSDDTSSYLTSSSSTTPYMSNSSSPSSSSELFMTPPPTSQPGYFGTSNDFLGDANIFSSPSLWLTDTTSGQNGFNPSTFMSPQSFSTNANNFQDFTSMNSDYGAPANTPVSSSLLRPTATPYAPYTPSRLSREVSPMMLDPALEDANVSTTAIAGTDAAASSAMMGLGAGMDLDFGLGAAPAGAEGWEMLDFPADVGMGGDGMFDFGF